jgi:thiol:disulfide interchange protein/DsbC/DsbD-like thiol-disulfide interchange protein
MAIGFALIWTQILVLSIAAGAGAAPEVPEGAFASGAVDRGGDRGGDPRVEARLLIDSKVVAGAERLRVGVFFELDRGWHIYWRHSGQTGYPTKLTWAVEGGEVGETKWPAPHVFKESDDTLTTYGYSDSVLLQSDLTVFAGIDDTLELAVDVEFLVCKVQCIPGQVSLYRSIPTDPSARLLDNSSHTLFDRWSAKVPRPAEDVGLTVDAVYSQSAIRPGDDFRAAVSLVCEGADSDASPCRGLQPYTRHVADSFVPDELPGLNLQVTGSRAHPFADGLLITLAGRADDQSEPEAQRLRGVARVLDGDGGSLAVEVDVPLPRAAAAEAVVQIDNPWLEPEARLGADISFPIAVLFALLGGLILNLMPCVLPVLAIKVFGIAERAHANRSEVLLHGIAYTAGILVTMLALAATVIALRSAGTSVGWGFQFQQPFFVAAISGLVLVFAMNLFGVFEIALPNSSLNEVGAAATGVRRSFFEGLLAVLLATPCSAPFLGTAVGFAFASSAPVIVGIFVAIGLGLAAPFVAITLVPGWAKLLPRGGAWMNHLRSLLGFALLATLVWLLWIIGRSNGTDGITLMLAFLVALSLGVWGYGVRQRASESGRAPLAAFIVVVLSVGGLAGLPLEVSMKEGSPTKADGESVAPFDPGAIALALDEGRPVFVYFTADWCLTCKVNENVVLTDSRVVEAFDRYGIANFEADWTQPDEAIRLELARFGRAGVPMYLLYDPRRPTNPELLPDVLTVDLVIEALRKTST